MSSKARVTRLLTVGSALAVLTVLFMLPFVWVAYVHSEREFIREAQLFHATISRHVNESETVLTGFAALHHALQDLEQDDRHTLRMYAREIFRHYPHLHELSIERRVHHEDMPGLVEEMHAAGKTDFEHRAFDFLTDRGWYEPPEREYYYPLVFAEPEPEVVPLLGLDPSFDPITGSAMEHARATGRPAASSPFERIRGGHAYVIFHPLYDRSARNRELIGFASLLVRAEELVPEEIIPPDVNIVIQPDRGDGSALELFRLEQSHLDSRTTRLLPLFHFQQITDGPGPRMIVELSASSFDAIKGHILAMASLPAGLLLASLALVAIRLRSTRLSERNAAAEAMFREKERAEVTLRAIGDGVITTDVDGCITYMNPKAEALTNTSLKSARSRPLKEVMKLIRSDNAEAIEYPVMQCIHDGLHSQLDRDAQLVSGSKKLDIEDSASPLHNYHGGIIGAVVIFRDVTDQRREMREISWQASHDPLTGLHNRRIFEQRLASALQSSAESPEKDVLCFIDLDNFKPVNDKHGHSTGDVLLRYFAQELKFAVREKDLVARLGGDEFAIVLYQCPIERAEHIIDDLQRKFADASIRIDDNTFTLRFSVGLLPLDGSKQSVAEALQRADAACYAAKRQNRNRVSVAP